jgi:hypothetical protein
MKQAPDYLKEALAVLEQRGHERDKPSGERSMEQCVDIFNAMAGTDLSETEGWLFMLALKISRSQGGGFKLDDYIDLIGYASLLTEAAVKEDAQSETQKFAPYLTALNRNWQGDIPE